jgi:hypothetical protein
MFKHRLQDHATDIPPLLPIFSLRILSAFSFWTSSWTRSTPPPTAGGPGPPVPVSVM